jgi:xanthine dehydrogenase accessory factor
MKEPSNTESLNPPFGGWGGWKFILDKLLTTQQVMLLYVLDSEGSSPGRQGFKMAVAADGLFYGTIGGGIMEHKLVEKAKSMLLQNENAVLLMRQHHDKEHTNNQSGMICSGSQLNAFIPLTNTDTLTIEKIIVAEKGSIQLSPNGLQIVGEVATGVQYKTDADWLYSEAINQQPVIHIIGGGHVGLALSELMNFLGFYIKLYDDRPALNTIAANSFANEKLIVNYDLIADQFTDVENDYAVIMTIGYRTDKNVLKQLLSKSFFYLGLLGSDYKIKMLLQELEAEGFSSRSLQNIHTPIGIDIFSKTTKEIAVSIAAEIIREKNTDLPTGRQQA